MSMDGPLWRESPEGAASWLRSEYPADRGIARLIGLADLGFAWAEAEAALPEGWEIDALYRVVSMTSLDREWEVIVHEDDWQGAEDNHAARGATPAAALRALAAKLRDRAV